jgi:AsmA protein
MRKLIKYVAFGMAALLLLVVLFAVLARIFITPERIRAVVVPAAEEALQREVRIGDIELRLFTGIVVRDLQVLEAGEAQPFVAAEQMVLRYRLWPLLQRRVVIDQIRLDAPAIRVMRRADGSFNFDDLLAEGEPPPERVQPDPEGAPIDLLVARIMVNDGELLFIDHALGGEEPHRLHITDLTVRARDISLDGDFPFEMSLRLNGGSLSLDGRANVQSRQGQAQIRLANLDVMAFAPYFAKDIPGELRSMLVQADLTVDGGAQRLNSRGRLALEGVALTLDALPDAPFDNARLALDYGLAADLQAMTLDLSDSRIDLNGLPVQVAGRVENFADEPRLDLRLAMADTELQRLLTALPAPLRQDLAGFAPSGQIGIDLHLLGSPQDMKRLIQSGSVRLRQVQGTVDQLRAGIDGRLLLSGDTVSSEQLSVQLGENRAALDLKASRLFDEPIVLTTRLTADRFDVDALLRTLGAPAAADTAPAPAGEIGPFDLPLRLDGQAHIGQTRYQGLQIDNLQARYRLEKNVLTIDKLSAQMAGGTLEQTARVDLGVPGLLYRFQTRVQGVQADPLVSAFFPGAAETVFGALDFSAELAGRGTTAEAVKKALSGQLDMRMVDGRLTGAGLVAGLAEFLNLEELRVLRFSQAEGNFRIKEGEVQVASEFSGADVRLRPRGSFGLDGNLDLRLDTRLAPQLMQKLDSRGRITQYLTDQQGWGQLALRLGGTVDAPRFALDTAGVREQVQDKAKQELQKKFQEKIIDRIAPPAEGDDTTPREPARRLLDDFRRGILGN